MLLVLWLFLFDIEVMAGMAPFVDCCCDFQFEPLPMVLRGLNQFMYVLSEDIYLCIVIQ